ncbi:MAG: TetR/AcrR family transcriptional regulator [Proteobacteria bacterium]|nr:MAG: TetR/AcrR family transcriptional regulator [Pseudomonadota bacterium]
MKVTKPKTPPIRQNDRNLSECKLLDAAHQLFLKLGFEGSTTRMIANQAGVNLALISKYFGNKEGLLISLLENRKRQMNSCSFTYPAEKDFVSEIKAHYEHMLEIHQTVGLDLMKIVISKSLTDENFNREIRSRMEYENKMLIERIQTHIDCGNVRAGVDAHQIEEQIRSYGVCQSFFGIILRGESTEKIRKHLHCFADTLGKAYVP